MAHPVTDLHFPPSVSKTFTSFPVTVSGNPNTDAPAQVYHMPCQLLVVHADGDVLKYTDNGSQNTITFASAGVTVIRMACNTIDSGTTCDSVTVFWQAPVMNY